MASQGASRRVIALALVVAGLALAGSSGLARQLAEQQRALGLTLDAGAASELPPDIRLAQVGLGSFRGLAITVLWIRAQDLEREGRFHESRRLTRTITRLQPGNPGVWAHLAHNLAFNLVHASRTPGERWAWVDAGRRLLRDEAIVLDPGEPAHYLELAILYRMKLVDNIDHEAGYYRRRMAAAWHAVTGSRPPTQEVARQRMLTVVEAPTLAELAADPATGAQVAQLTQRGYRLDRSLFVRLQRAAIHDGLGRSFGLELPDDRGRDPWLLSWLRDASIAAPRRQLLAAVRAHVIRERERLDPRRMLALVEELGSIDWRHPAAHQLYWARAGIELMRPTRLAKATPQARPDSAERIWQGLWREQLRGLGELVMSGDVDYDPAAPGALLRWPAPTLIEAYDRLYRQTLEQFPDHIDHRRGFYRAYDEVLTHTISHALAIGERALAKRVYHLWCQRRDQPPELSVEAFALRAWGLDVAVGVDRELLLQRINALCRRAVRSHYGRHDRRGAARAFDSARRLYQTARRHASAGTRPLPRFIQLALGALEQELRRPAEDPSEVLRMIRIYRAAPPEWIALLWDRVKHHLWEVARLWGFDPQLAFPPPPGAKPPGQPK